MSLPGVGSGYKKLLKKSVIIILMLILVVAGIQGKRSLDKSNLDKWCKSNLTRQEADFNSKKWESIRKNSEKELNKCSDIITEADKVTVYKNLAASNYLLKDRTQATFYANKGLALNDSLTSKERSKVKNQADAVFIMTDVKYGSYTDFTPSPIGTTR